MGDSSGLASLDAAGSIPAGVFSLSAASVTACPSWLRLSFATQVSETAPCTRLVSIVSAGWPFPRVVVDCRPAALAVRPRLDSEMETSWGLLRPYSLECPVVSALLQGDRNRNSFRRTMGSDSGLAAFSRFIVDSEFHGARWGGPRRYASSRAVDAPLAVGVETPFNGQPHGIRCVKARPRQLGVVDWPSPSRLRIRQLRR